MKNWIIPTIAFILTFAANAQWNTGTSGQITYTNGKVGIGTSATLSDILEVQGSSSSNIRLRVRNTNTGHGSGTSIMLYANAFGNRISTLSNIPDFNGSNFIFNIRKADNSYFDAMTLKDQSNETALWINNQTTSSTSASGFRVNSQGNNVRLISYADSHTTHNNENWLVSQAGGSSLVFGTQDVERMRVHASGNIGIGTSTPSEKLEVNGTIRSKEVKVEATGWPDYVFEEDYNLRSLEETEAYIKENKHLPEIPSAKEMEANGVQLGEMNMLLLKKIEELTLHVIELKKENESQQQEIEKLKQNKD